MPNEQSSANTKHFIESFIFSPHVVRVYIYVMTHFIAAGVYGKETFIFEVFHLDYVLIETFRRHFE